MALACYRLALDAYLNLIPSAICDASDPLRAWLIVLCDCVQSSTAQGVFSVRGYQDPDILMHCSVLLEYFI